MTFPFSLIGFDLDGTLLDTSEALAASVNHALAAAGRAPVATARVRPMIGKGARHMLSEGLAATGGSTHDLLDRHLPALLDHYGANLHRGSPAFEGLDRMMDRLDAMGVAMAVVTNKREAFAVTLLQAVGLLDRFACVIGGDTMGPGRGKPAADPIEEMLRRCGTAAQDAAFVGDSIVDVQAAHAAGLPCIAVSFGFLSQPVGELGADAVIDHYDDLVGTLETLRR